MEKLERIGKQSRYDGMVKPPAASAVAAGNRRPVYINYTPEGRKKEQCGSRLIKEGGSNYEKI